MRHSEIDKLTPSDVVCREIHHTSGSRIRWEVYISDAKTQSFKNEKQVAWCYEENLPKEVVPLLQVFQKLDNFSGWIVPSTQVCKHIHNVLNYSKDSATVFHGLRHGRATFLRKQLGFSIAELMEAGRWKDPKSVDIYVHL